MVNVTVNGQAVSVAAGDTVLTAVRAAGVQLPTLCYWDGLPAYGACRLCLVAITAPHRTVVASCTYPVEEGLVVETEADDAVALRRMALEFLLSRCPTSDVIRSLAAREGLTGSRFGPPPMERADELCVLCGLCVRVCRDLVGAAAIGFSGRGAARRVGAPFDVQAEACIGCGACAAVCPTGAVRIEDRDHTRILHTWNTEIPLRPCSSCGRPYGPEPLVFLRQLVETGELAWGVCPACRRKATLQAMDVVRG